MPETYTNANDTYLEVYNQAQSTWEEIPGTASITESTSAPPQIVRNDYHGHHTVMGRLRPANLDIALSAFMPAHSTTLLLRNAQKNRSPLTFRYTVPGDILWNGFQTAMRYSLQEDGIASFTNDVAPDFDSLLGTGMAILSDGGRMDVIDYWNQRLRTIQTSSRGTAFTGRRLSFVVPGIRRPDFQAHILTWGETILDVNAAITTRLNLISLDVLPDLVLHNQWRV